MRNDGHLVNEKRIRRLMRLIGLMPIYQKPMRRGFLYIVAIMDWHTHKVLSWRISNMLE
ncbi:hypothetical protein [Paracoccus sp. R86501]|uniref:hypothetical protein n=1 Tax=Paracoccus sp. R86501 TaxID=3101711 RepID=UPI00366CC3E4